MTKSIRILIFIFIIIPVDYNAQTEPVPLSNIPGILLVYHSVKFFAIISFILLAFIRTRLIAGISLLFDAALIIMSGTYRINVLTGGFASSSYVTFGFQLISLSFVLGWIYRSNRKISEDKAHQEVSSGRFERSERVAECFRAVFVSFILADLFSLLQFFAFPLETTGSFIVLYYFVPPILVILILWLQSRAPVAAWIIAAGYLLDILIMSVFMHAKNAQVFPEQMTVEATIIGLITLFIKGIFCVYIYLNRVRSIFKAKNKHIIFALVTAAVFIFYEFQMMMHPDSPFYDYSIPREITADPPDRTD